MQAFKSASRQALETAYLIASDEPLMWIYFAALIAWLKLLAPQTRSEIIDLLLRTSKARSAAHAEAGKPILLHGEGRLNSGHKGTLAMSTHAGESSPPRTQPQSVGSADALII